MLQRSLASLRRRIHQTKRRLPRSLPRICLSGVVACVLLYCLAPATAAPPSLQLYVFGDSLSDTGNAFNRTGSPTRPYADGRFSNGLVWVDRLAEQFRLTLTPITASSASSASSINFAFGGAQTGTTNNTEGLPGLQQEVELFRTRQSPSSDALYLVWAGANDYLSGRFLSASEPIANLKTAIAALIDGGARQIVVVNLPNLGQLPATRNRDAAAELDRLAADHNQQLAALVTEFSQQDGLTLRLLDVQVLFERAVAGEFDFTNVTQACFDRQAQTVCSTPDAYLFWDGIHPSAAAHRYISEAALPLISSMSPIRESSPAAPRSPAAAIKILALGAVAVAIAAQIKRR